MKPTKAGGLLLITVVLLLLTINTTAAQSQNTTDYRFYETGHLTNDNTSAVEGELGQDHGWNDAPVFGGVDIVYNASLGYGDVLINISLACNPLAGTQCHSSFNLTTPVTNLTNISIRMEINDSGNGTVTNFFMRGMLAGGVALNSFGIDSGATVPGDYVVYDDGWRNLIGRTNARHNLTMWVNDTGDLMFYVDGVLGYSRAAFAPTGFDAISIGMHTLTVSRLLSIRAWDGSPDDEPQAPAPASANITMTALNPYNSTALQDFNVTVGNSTHEKAFSTESGTITGDVITGTYLFNFSADNHFNSSISATVAASDNVQGELYQAYLTCLATEYVSNATINTFNCTAGLAFNTTTNGSTVLLVNAETYSVNWSAPDHYTENQTQTFSAVTSYALTQQLGTALISFEPVTYLNQTGISSFSVYLESQNYTWNETRNSSGNFVNWTYLINGTYTVQVNASGYFFHEGTLTVTNSSASYKPSLWTSEYRVYAQDILTSAILTDFSVLDQFGTLWNSSGNETILYLDVGAWNFTLLKNNYVNQSWLYNTTTLSNESTTRQLTPRINYSLIDERTLDAYDVASTEETYLDVFCNNETIHGDFKTTNESQLFVDVSCEYYMVKVTTTYNGSTYFRTLVPDISEREIVFYMVDLSTDTVVQRILNLIDLTGDYSDAEIRVGRFLSGAFRDIVRQPFDLQDSVTMYLKQDELYVLSLFDNDGTERSLGNLIADSAGEQTVTFPLIEFFPDTYMGDEISWAYTFNASAGFLRVQYEDTSNLTTWLQFTVYNETWSQLFQTSSNLSDVTITYNGIVENLTYISRFEVLHPNTDTINETKTHGSRAREWAVLEGWDDDELASAKNWISWFGLTVVLLLFSQVHAQTGAILTMLLASLLRLEGWFTISPLWLSIGWMLAILSLVTRRLKK